MHVMQTIGDKMTEEEVTEMLDFYVDKGSGHIYYEDFAEHLATVFDEVNGDGGGAGRAPSNAPAAGAEALRVASKLAHDANSWIANATFRLATMRPSAQDDEQFTAHLDSIESSLRAVASIAAGARGLVADDAAAVECEPVTLDAALLDGWRAPAGCGEVEIHVEAIPPVSADRPALTAVLSILADNVSLHGEGGHLRLELRSGAGAITNKDPSC